MASNPIMFPLEAVLQRFPNLDPKQTAITSPSTPKYNCIAYAAGDQQNWWEPDAHNMWFWPQGVIRQMTKEAYVQAFESLGYAVTTDGSFVLGQEKIALFHKNNVPTHAAIQLNNGVWSSKLGPWYDISHDLNGIQGENYGEIFVVMQRSRKAA